MGGPSGISASAQPQPRNDSSDQSKSGPLSVLNQTAPPSGSSARYLSRNSGAVRRRLNCFFFGHGSGKLMYRREISPGANISGRSSAYRSRKRTFGMPCSTTRSIATTIASGTFSSASSSTSGSRSACSQVKRPLPQPSSRRISRYCENSSAQRPLWSSGVRICTAAQRSIRGIRFGFFRILIRFTLLFLSHAIIS